MIVNRGHIVEATEQELCQRWVDTCMDMVMSFEDYLRLAAKTGIKVTGTEDMVTKENSQVKVTILEYPNEKDWKEVKRRALVTVGKKPVTAPTNEWKKSILNARHSPIRYLRFSVLLESVPYWVSVHLVRHVHAQPYVRSQRNDRQSEYDRTSAPQNAPVDMIWDFNAEELMTIANKRLCNQASDETRKLVQTMCDKISELCPEFKPFLVPMCVYQGGVCHEMNPCGRIERG